MGLSFSHNHQLQPETLTVLNSATAGFNRSVDTTNEVLKTLNFERESSNWQSTVLLVAAGIGIVMIIQNNAILNNTRSHKRSS